MPEVLKHLILVVSIFTAVALGYVAGFHHGYFYSGDDNVKPVDEYTQL